MVCYSTMLDITQTIYGPQIVTFRLILLYTNTEFALDPNKSVKKRLRGYLNLIQYIEDIQVFGVNMSFISLSEVKKLYIS